MRHPSPFSAAALALAAPLVLAWLGAGASSAHAQASEQVRRAQAELSFEPEVAETARQALEYFRVNPEALDGMRSASRARALLPVIAGGYQYNQTRDTMLTQQMGMPTFEMNGDSVQSGHLANIGALWDLRQLAFNSAEVQVYGLVAVQRDIMLEITRTYFLRRQLQLRLRLRPPEDALAYAGLELRILEFTATLDVLTNGWFTEESERRRRRAGGG
jgi:hypothetical protein